MEFNKLLAKDISYAPASRSLDKVKAIVIHNTGGTSDTAENNAKYFANTNTRAAGAHWFVDRDGNIWRSIPMKYCAYAVGGIYNLEKGSKYYGTYTNANTVSIELCAIAKKMPSKKQIAATKELVAYIKDKCPNVERIVRHYDINGKPCPAIMCGSTLKNSKWKAFRKKIK